jgi:hypothetical protein
VIIVYWLWWQSASEIKNQEMRTAVGQKEDVRNGGGQGTMGAVRAVVPSRDTGWLMVVVPYCPESNGTAVVLQKDACSLLL